MLISIYALRDSRQTQSTSYFYVGSAKDSVLRLEQHKKHANEDATKLYYAEMREIGIENVVADELDVAFDESERIDIEEFWWQQLKSVGHPILNGSPKRGYAKIYAEGFSPEHRKALGDAQRGKERPNRKGKPSGMKGKAYPESGKKALSDYYRERRESGNPVKRTGEAKEKYRKAKAGKSSFHGENMEERINHGKAISASLKTYFLEIKLIQNELGVNFKIARLEYKTRKGKV